MILLILRITENIILINLITWIMKIEEEEDQKKEIILSLFMKFREIKMVNLRIELWKAGI